MKKIKILTTALLGVFLFSLDGAANTDPAARRQCYEMDPVSCETFYRTNAERRKNRLPAMSYCSRCFSMAQDHSEDMVARKYFSHNRPASGRDPGETFSRRAARYGLSHAVAENIAWGGDAKSVVGRWMKSPGHRKNILNPKYDTFAVGFHKGYYTQVFSRNAPLQKKTVSR